MPCIQKIDGISASLSLIGFLVSLYYVQDTDVKMWENNMIFSTSSNMTAATDVLGTVLFETCGSAFTRDESGPYTMHQHGQDWGGDNFTGTSIAVDTGRSYKPWVMLHWILVCSCLFQGARCVTFCEHDDAREDILFQYVPSSGPDFWRWVEYALTSPLQIIIIAGSFYIRETSQLITLAGLQGVLVLLGYVIELEIQTICLQKVAAWHRQYEEKSRVTVGIFVAQCRLTFLLLCSYVCHAIIWAILISKFQMQAAAIRDCQNPTHMPDEIIIIIVLECVLFTLFGLVLTIQAVQVSLASHLDAVMVQSSWTNVSGWYSVLSLSAKLVLEWGFIALLTSSDAQNSE